MLPTFERGHPKSPGKGAAKPYKHDHSLPHGSYLPALTGLLESYFIQEDHLTNLLQSTCDYASMPPNSKRVLRKR